MEEQVFTHPEKSMRLGPEQKEILCSLQCTIGRVYSVGFYLVLTDLLVVPQQNTSRTLSDMSTLSQARPGAGGKLLVYDLCQLKSCSHSLLLLVA